MNEGQESLQNILEKTQKKSKITQKQIDSNIDNFIQLLEEAQNKMQPQFDAKPSIDELHQNLQSIKPLSNITNLHKDQHQFISKLGRMIDKQFSLNLDIALQQQIHFNKQLVKPLLDDYLLKERKFEIQECFENEYENPSQNDKLLIGNYKLISCIDHELSKQNLQPAIEWATNHSFQINEIQSDFLFNLHKLQYIQILKTKNNNAALEYAKQNFQQYAHKNQIEIQKLMSQLIFFNTSSVFNQIDEKSLWIQIKSQLYKTFYQIIGNLEIYFIGQMESSPLEQCTIAGTLALPKFIKYFKLMPLNNQEWNQIQELPIEVELGDYFKKHSIFVCPVSREISTEENPPVLLICGHVISYNSMKKMTLHRSLFKCPTCPQEQFKSQIRQMHI